MRNIETPKMKKIMNVNESSINGVGDTLQSGKLLSMEDLRKMMVVTCNEDDVGWVRHMMGA